MSGLPTATVQALLTEARFLDTKPAASHKMAYWVSECGTQGCAVGDMAARGDLGLGYLLSPRGIFLGITFLGQPCEDTMAGVAIVMGISEEEAMFLFDSRIHHFVSRNYQKWRTSIGKGERNSDVMWRHRQRCDESPQETAARIRKFVYYKLRKAELLADYEQARRTGDAGVSDFVKGKLEEEVQP